MSNDKVNTDGPVILFEIPKSQVNVIRLIKKTWCDEEIFELREYYQASDGRWWATKRGVNLAVKNWRKLLPVLTEALHEEG